MTWIDWVIVSIIFFNMLHGFYLGTFRTFLHAVKYPIAFLLILFFSPQVGEFLLKPWNLTQNIALSLKDMVILPDFYYNKSVQISRLGEELSRGDFPHGELFQSIQEMLTHIELAPTLRELLTSMFGQERIVEYLVKQGPIFAKYPIDNLGDLAFYTLGSFIAKLFAISLGAIVIIVIVSCISHFAYAFINHGREEGVTISLGSRFLAAGIKGGVCFLVSVLLLEVSTPLLCYFMIDPNHSVVFSMILDSAYHIKPWMEWILLTM